MKTPDPKPRPDPISIRLPEELRTSLSDAATAGGRSVNAEIRMRLEWSFESGFSGQASDKMLANEIEGLRAELRGAISAQNAAIEKLREEIEGRK